MGAGVSAAPMRRRLGQTSPSFSRITRAGPPIWRLLAWSRLSFLWRGAGRYLPPRRRIVNMADSLTPGGDYPFFPREPTGGGSRRKPHLAERSPRPAPPSHGARGIRPMGFLNARKGASAPPIGPPVGDSPGARPVSRFYQLGIPHLLWEVGGLFGDWCPRPPPISY